jgi:anti-anti-sigma regulatory factor
MNILVSQATGKTPVTILAVEGDLDGSNYQTLIAKAREAHTTGAQRLLIDMSKTSYMSSAGLVALHSIALILRGEEPPDPEYGWNAYHAIARDKDSGGRAKQLVKLVNPQPKVARTLQMTGMNEFFDIHTDIDTAVASFQ